MFLTEKYSAPLFTSNPTRKPPKPFDSILSQRLNSLIKSQPSNSISFLCSAIQLLSSTLSTFSAFLSDPNLSTSEHDTKSLSSHLNFSLSLLDKINSLSCAIDQISCRRLHASLAVHLLSGENITPEISSKARASIAEWKKKQPPCLKSNIVRTPNLKMTAIGRALYAVEAVSELVTELVAAALGGSFDLKSIRVSGDFCWADAFNEVSVAAMRMAKNGRVSEIEDVDACLTELETVIEDQGMEERLTTTLMKAETAVVNLMEGLDGLRNEMNGLFRNAMNERNKVLNGFRLSLAERK